LSVRESTDDYLGDYTAVNQGAGFQKGWDRNTGGGRTDFCAYGQNGAGGFDFWYANVNSTTPTQLASMQPGDFTYNGAITTGTLNVNTLNVLQPNITNATGSAPILFSGYDGPLIETYFGTDDRYGLNRVSGIMRMYASFAYGASALALSLNSNNQFTDYL
jgi:hypothetical protein